MLSFIYARFRIIFHQNFGYVSSWWWQHNHVKVAITLERLNMNIKDQQEMRRATGT